MKHILQAIKARLLGRVDEVVSDMQRGIKRLEALAHARFEAEQASIARAQKHQREANEHAGEAGRALRVAAKMRSLLQ